MADTICLRVFGVFTAVFGLAGLLTGTPVTLGIAGLALSLLLGEVLMGGEDITRRRSARRRTDIAPTDSPR